MNSHILPVYNRSKINVSHGKGMYLYDTNGKAYLDFVSGVAVNCLGHAPDVLIETLHEQAKKLWHISNIYQIPGMDDFATALTSKTFADVAFFCNSGAEAVECCIKMVRKHFDQIGKPNKYRIITFEGAFHGRTLAAIWASKRDTLMQDGFGPPVEGFDHIPLGDLNAVKQAITDETAAILIEPIQGDGGIRVVPHEFLAGLRQLCDEHGLLLCFDEIQCGMGRTGTLYAHELYGVTPDIMTSAKGIGGGFPLGACLATTHAACGMTTGTHGSTYGGNPLAMAVGKKVLEIISNPTFLKHVQTIGVYFKEQLHQLAQKHPGSITQIRGEGLILGIQFIPNNKELMAKLEEQGLLVAPAGENVLRLLPPLIIEKQHVDEAITILDTVLRAVK